MSLSGNGIPRSGVRELALWTMGRRRRFRVVGSSMFPLVDTGDEILVDTRAYRCRSPSVGDIVLAQHPFRRDLRLVKQVVRVSSAGRLELRGLHALENTDSRAFGSLPPQLLLGRVTSRLP